MNKDERRRSWPARAGVSIKQTKFVHACLWRRLDRVVTRTIDFGMKGYENKHVHKRRSCKAAHIPNCVVSVPSSNGRRTEFSYAVIICHWREASKHKLWWHLSMLTKRTDILYCISMYKRWFFRFLRKIPHMSLSFHAARRYEYSNCQTARPLADWNHWAKKGTHEIMRISTQQITTDLYIWALLAILRYNAYTMHYKSL